MLSACDPCEDCGNPVIFDPTFNLTFINADSIKKIDDSLTVIAFNDSALSSHINVLDTLRNRLDEVQMGIDTGNTTLQEEKELILMLIPENQTDSSLFATLNQDADSISSILNLTKSTINTGLLKVDSIQFIGTRDTLLFLDSASNYTIPLSFDKSFTQYAITIDGTTYLIEVDYTIFEEIDIERNVLLRAKDIQLFLPQNSFDSLQTCETCTDGEASFILYF